MRPGRRFIAILIPGILIAGYWMLTHQPGSDVLEPATPVLTIELNGEHGRLSLCPSLTSTFTATADYDPAVLQALKRILQTANLRSFAEAQVVERAEFPKLWAGEAHLKAVAEFLSRTAPESKSEADS